jgi:Transposase DDE domain
MTNGKGKGKDKGKVTPVIISARMQGYIVQLETARPHLPQNLTHLAADSFYSKKSFVDAVIAADLHLVSKLRIDADLRYGYTGPQKPRGAPRKYDGKVDLSDLSRLELVTQPDPNIQLYSQVVWHISLKRQIRIVYLINISQPDKPRVALLFSTDTTLAPERLHQYYKVRFQIEFIFRDAKQFTGLSDCQSRQPDALDFHFNATLAALNLAKLEQRQSQPQSSRDPQPMSCSIATYKRQALNHHFLERFITLLDLDPTLIKSHPNYPSLLQYGALAP